MSSQVETGRGGRLPSALGNLIGIGYVTFDTIMAISKGSDSKKVGGADTNRSVCPTTSDDDDDGEADPWPSRLAVRVP